MKWEYLTTGSENGTLDKYGSDGWELVQVVPRSDRSMERWIFKRPIPEDLLEDMLAEDPNE